MKNYTEAVKLLDRSEKSNKLHVISNKEETTVRESVCSKYVYEIKYFYLKRIQNSLIKLHLEFLFYLLKQIQKNWKCTYINANNPYLF